MKNKTLHTLLTWKMALFVVFLNVVMLSTVAVLMTSSLQKELKNSIFFEAVHVEEVLENHLAFQRENTATLAANNFIINSLVDVSGRGAYLPTLVDEFLTSRQVAAVTVVDYDGMAIHSSMDNPPPYMEITQLRSSLETGRPFLQISSERQRLIFVEPIFYYQTPQGALVIETSLSSILSQVPYHSKNFSLRLVHQGQVLYEDHNQDDNKEYLTFIHEVSPGSTNLRELGLALEIGTRKSSYTGIVFKVVLQLAILGIISTVAAFLIVRKMSQTIAKPINTLCEKIRSGDLPVEVKQTSVELEELVQAFNERSKQLNTEIKERKLAEEKLKLSNTRLESIFRAAPIGIGVVIDRKFTEVNQRIINMVGYSRNELIGNVSRLIYPSDEEFERVGKYKYDQIREHGTGSVETVFQKKDGSLINVLLSSTPLDLNDYSLGVTFAALDITERKKMEDELRESRDHLEELVKERTFELEQRNEKLQKFNKLFVEREVRIKELRDEVARLRQKG